MAKVNDEHESAVGGGPAGPDERQFPMADFVNNGLLLHVNREFFWPLGMALSVAGYHDSDQYRRMTGPRIEWALRVLADRMEKQGDTPSAALGAIEIALRHLSPADCHTLAELILDTMLEGIKPGTAIVAEGLRLIETIPPERIRSRRTPEEESGLLDKASAWLGVRRATVKP